MGIPIHILFFKYLAPSRYRVAWYDNIYVSKFFRLQQIPKLMLETFISNAAKNVLGPLDNRIFLNLAKSRYAQN